MTIEQQAEFYANNKWTHPSQHFHREHCKIDFTTGASFNLHEIGKQIGAKQHEVIDGAFRRIVVDWVEIREIFEKHGIDLNEKIYF